MNAQWSPGMAKPFPEREVSWRVFAHELSSTTIEEREAGKESVHYLLSPLGARMNRALLFGNLSEVEEMGSEKPFWRAKVDEPTGTITLTAGVYQPKAMAFLSEVKPPVEISVIGKPHLFVSAKGRRYHSLRAESVTIASPEEVARGWVETASSTLKRIELMKALSQERPLGKEELLSHGYPPLLVAGAMAAREHYPETDLESFIPPVEKVMKTVLRV